MKLELQDSTLDPFMQFLQKYCDKVLKNDSSLGMEPLERRQNVPALSLKHRQLPGLRFLVDKFLSLLHEQDADGRQS